VILINLLPHREMARQRQRRLFHGQLAVSALLGVALSAAVFAAYRHALDAQEARNQWLLQSIARLDQDIRALETLAKNRAAWQVRLHALERLQTDRQLPAHLLQELVLQVPAGVVLSSLRQDGASVMLGGAATSQERVAALLHNLGSSDWLSRPELVEMVGMSADSGAGSTAPQPEPRPTARFTVRVFLGPPAAGAVAGPGG
jgi:type IV pilus assembly protein PilN